MPARPFRRITVVLLLAVPALLGLFPLAARAAMIGAGLAPRTVALGDLNEDGIPDLIAGNEGDSSVVVMLQRGGGQFQPKVLYRCGSQVYGVAVADLNGDGHLDVISACPNINRIGVRFGAGDGTLGARTDYNVIGATSVAVGDFNADGWVDLAVANQGANPLAVLLGAGGGVLVDAYYLGGPSSFAIATGDLNGDGNLDVVTTNTLTNGVSVRLGTGAGTFTAATTVSTDDPPWGVTLADFNNDGVLDMAMAIKDFSEIGTRLGNGDGTFGTYRVYSSATHPISIASSDFNGDGKRDVAVCSTDGGGVSVLNGTGTGTFAPESRYVAGLNLYGIAAGDIDQNGSADVAVGVMNANSINTLLNNGNGTFAVPSGAVYVWLPTGSASFSLPANWAPTRNSISGSDILVFNNGANTTAMNFNNGTLGQIAVIGGTTVALQGLSGGITTSLFGGSGDDLLIEQGSTLALNSANTNTVTIDITSTANAWIDGDLAISGGANRLRAANTHGIVFQSHGRALIGPGSSSTPFGDGTGSSGLNSVLFHFGSQYIAGATVAVFGASAPNAVVEFWPGSRFRQDVAFTPAASGRTYADFEYNVPNGNTQITGANPFQVDSLIVTQGTFNVAMTGAVTIRGDVECGCSGTLRFLPATPATYRLGGTALQHIRVLPPCFGMGLYASPKVTLNIDNPAGVELGRTWYTSANFQFTHGVLSMPPFASAPPPGGFHLALDSTATITGASQATGWVSTRLWRRVTTNGVMRLDVGDSLHYLPIDVNVHGVTAPGYVYGGTYGADDPLVAGAQLDLAHLAHRAWVLEAVDDDAHPIAATFFSNLDATFSFVSADLSPGTDPSQLVMRRYSANQWSATTPGALTATSIQVPGLTSAMVSNYSELQAGQPITPSMVAQNGAAPEGSGAVAARVRRAGAQAAGSLAFHVSLSQAAIDPVSVDYQTVDGSATVADGDYTPQSGTLSLAPGDTAKDIVVPFGVDATPERNETFALALSNASNATLTTPSVTGTILDDDDVTPPTATVVSPNGGETVFVGNVVPLQWAASDNVAVSSVDLFLSRNDGGKYETVALGVPNTGSYDWTAAGTTSTTMRLRVVAHDDPGHTGADVSDAAWTLSSGPSGVDDTPVSFALPPIAPNPAPAGRARITFAVPRPSAVRLTVHDLQGRTVATLVDGIVPSGRHERTWDTGARAASGIYFVRFEAPGFHAEQRLVVVH